MRPGGLGIAVAAQTPDAQSLAAASGGEPPAAPAVVDPQPAGGVFLSFMLLALLLVLRGDLLDRWQQQLPPQSPNYFLINIALSR